MNSANKGICLISIVLLSSLVIHPQQKSSKDETVFYDITVQFDGSAECDPCNGPYLTKLNFAAMFERVKFKFAKYNDEEGAGLYNWYFSARAGKSVQGYPIISMLGEGKIWSVQLCDKTLKKDDCNDLQSCFFTTNRSVLMPMLVVIPQGEIEDAEEVFGTWGAGEDSIVDIPLTLVNECIVQVIFGLRADELMTQKAKVEWKCEDWKEPNSIEDIEFVFALPKDQLLKGLPLQYEFDYEHPDVPGPGKLTVVLYPSD
jgi:hypothetical protein